MVSYGLVVGLQTCWFIVMLGYSLAQLRFVGLPFCSMLAIRTVDMSTTVVLWHGEQHQACDSVF